MSATPTPSAVFAFADEVVDRLAKSDPLFATEAGIPGYERLLPDFSAAQQRRDQDETLRDLQALELLDSVSDVDRIAKEVLRERLSVRLALLEADEYRRTFSVLNSPVAAIRQVFELMATSTADDATHVAARLKAVRPSLDTWRGALLVTAAEHELPAARHVLGIADQADTHAAGAFTELAERVAAATSVDVATSGLANAAQDAEAAFAELAAFLRSDIASRALDARGLWRRAIPALVGLLVRRHARSGRTVRLGLPGSSPHQRADVGDCERTASGSIKFGVGGRSFGPRPEASH